MPTSFDASSSTVAVGTIAGFAWSFGDGATQTTTTPTVTHVYQAGGSYTASVTETDSAGTSTKLVFTGRIVIRNGGPAATASRSVVVTSSPAPAVKLSSSALDLGRAPLGHASLPQTVTITNTGDAPLSITRASFSGANAADFSLASDACTGQSVPVAGSCMADIEMTPHRAGLRTAQLAFTDNASGSPHTLSLSGVGLDRAALTGTVRDLATQQPVGDVDVSVCTYSTHAVCRDGRTDAAGAYAVGGLPPGRYQIEVLPSGGGLFPASAVLELPIGVTGQDFALGAPTSMPAGFAFNGSGGGVPTGFWTAPKTVSAPLYVPASPGDGVLGATVLYFNADSDTGDGSQLASEALTGVYRYDASGVPRFVALNPGAPFVGVLSDSHPGALGAGASAPQAPRPAARTCAACRSRER
jgi:hypothetical protein